MKIPNIRNFNEYLIYKNGEKIPIDPLGAIDGHNTKDFVLCDSEYFKEFFDEIKNNAYASYVTYLNDFIRENYDGEHLPISEVSCFKKLGEDNLIEEYVSRFANALHIPTTYIKNVPSIAQEEFRKKLYEMIDKGIPDSSISLSSENYLLSIDFIGKNEYFDTLNEYAHSKVHEDVVESNSNIREWFAGFEHTKLRNPQTETLLTKEQKTQLFREFIPQFFFRQYIIRDWDFKSENVGIIYNEENNSYKLAPMFDLEYSYNLTGQINYAILEEDLIFAYDAFPEETTNFMKEVENLDIDKFLDETITIFECKNRLTTEQAIMRETIRTKFNEFKALIRELEYTKDFVE